jgi:AcrR family transcriptional regulator
MSVIQRRAREKQELRQEILETARTLFAREGYEAVTMRKIAEAIEYSPTAIYLYFTDKQELLQELCRVDFLALAKQFQRIAEVSDPLERLRQAGFVYVEFGLTHPNHYRLMFMTPHPRVSAEAELTQGKCEEDAYAFLKVIVGQCIEAGLFRDEFTDGETVSQLLWAGVHGLVSLHVAIGDEDWVEWRPIRELTEKMLAMQLHGLLREPGTRS